MTTPIVNTMSLEETGSTLLNSIARFVEKDREKASHALRHNPHMLAVDHGVSKMDMGFSLQIKGFPTLYMKNDPTWRIISYHAIAWREEHIQRLTNILHALERPQTITADTLYRIATMMRDRTDEQSQSNDFCRWADLHFWIYHNGVSFEPEVEASMRQFEQLIDTHLSELEFYADTVNATKTMKQFYDWLQIQYDLRHHHAIAPIECEFQHPNELAL